MQSLTLFLLLLAFVGSLCLECDIPEDKYCRPEEEDEAQFEANAEFPLKDYNNLLKKNKTVKAIVKTMSAELNRDDLDVITIPNWQLTCPSYSYIIYRWLFYHGVHGRCYVITPIRATRCATRYCRWTWKSTFWPFFRCFPRYRAVRFWAYCPFSQSGSWQLMYRIVTSGCSCRFFLCSS